MKYLSILFILFSASFVNAQSFTVDSLGINSDSLIIIKVTQIDTLPNGDFNIKIFKTTKSKQRKKSINRIKGINKHIKSLQNEIKALKERRRQIKQAFNITPSELD